MRILTKPTIKPYGAAKVPDKLIDENKKIKKELRELKSECTRLSSDIYKLENKIDDINTAIERRIAERMIDHEEFATRIINDSLPALVEKAMGKMNLEDSVLLKVVKATFNNYKEDDGRQQGVR